MSVAGAGRHHQPESEEPLKGAIDQLFRQPLRYVALGDSFVAGEGAGAGNYFPGPNKCHRAPSAYSFVMGVRSPSVRDDVLNVACTGAKIEHLYNTYKDEQPQLNALKAANDADGGRHPVQLVTIGIGGNDIGFEGVIKSCFLQNPPLDRRWYRPVLAAANAYSCVDEIDRKRSKGFSDITTKLKNAIIAAANKAPKASIALVSYPQVVPHRFALTDPSRCVWLQPWERAAARNLVGDLNLAMWNATEQAKAVVAATVRNKGRLRRHH